MDNNKMNNKKKRKNLPYHLKLSYLYYICCFLRVLLALAPQPGYIHPDEYMQSVEVVTGNIMDVEYTKVWEFDSSFPIRSILPPYVMVGLPIFVYKTICNLMDRQPRISPHFLVTLSRVVCCLSSFLVDYSLYKICYLYNENARKMMIVLGTSYIMLVYATRTLTNSTELVLMSLLLYYVSRSIIVTKKNLEKREEIFLILDDDERSYVEKIHYKRILKKIGNSIYEDSGAISLICVLGVFNRPTFIAYAFAPVFFWLTRGLRSPLITFRHFHLRFLRLIVQAIPYATLMIIVDSIYHGYTTLEEMILFSKKLSFSKNFVLTPYNFFLYNLNHTNLGEHGLHPRYTHVILNIPLLFSVLGCMFLGTVVSLMSKVFNRQWRDLPSVESINGLMLCSCIVPIVMLSAVPHQEARFLIPLTLPVVYLCSDKLMNMKIGHRTTSIDSDTLKTTLVAIWCFSNVVLTIFYAFIHQAGVLPVANHMSSVIENKEKGTDIYLVTSYVYQFPKSLMQVPRFDKIRYGKSNNVKYKRRADFFLHELGSSRTMNHACHILHLITKKIKENESYKGKEELYFLIPNTKRKEFETAASKRGMGYKMDRLFYPHLSTEALPNLLEPTFDGSSRGPMLGEFIEKFGLTLYVIKI